MNRIQDLRIFIVEYDKEKAEIVRKVFKGYRKVIVINDDLYHFFNEEYLKNDYASHKCIVSPGNSFGHMAGGFDARISDILGWEFQNKVQQYIKDNYEDGQPVGTSIVFSTHIKGVSLIHTPTMYHPSIIKDNLIIRDCMESTLKCALQNDVGSIIVPLFGGQCGGVTAETAANRMLEAYELMSNNVLMCGESLDSKLRKLNKGLDKNTFRLYKDKISCDSDEFFHASDELVKKGEKALFKEIIYRATLSIINQYKFATNLGMDLYLFIMFTYGLFALRGGLYNKKWYPNMHLITLGSRQWEFYIEDGEDEYYDEMRRAVRDFATL